jgi:hypothetical protein
MMDIEGAIYQRLISDAAITSRVNVYRGAPAVFTFSPVPDEAALPYIVVNPVSDIPLDTLAENGRQVVRDIACYVPNTGSVEPITRLSEAVRARFHRQVVTLDGYTNFLTSIVGLITAPTDRTVFGRIISVRFSLRQNP